MEVQAVFGGWSLPLGGSIAARPSHALPLQPAAAACLDRLILDGGCRTKDLLSPGADTVAFSTYLEELNRQSRIDPAPGGPLPFAVYLEGVNRAARLAEPINPFDGCDPPERDRRSTALPAEAGAPAVARSPHGSPRLGDVPAPTSAVRQQEPASRPPLVPLLTGRVLDVFA